jgi:autotransporter-associated beta strand protein
VVKNGLGEVKMVANNTYTGGTRVYGGDLDVATIGNLGVLAAGAPRPDFLTLNGGTIQLSAPVVNGVVTSPLLTFDVGYGVVLGSAGGTFALDPTSTVDIKAPISGPGGLGVGSKTILSAGGLLKISGNNTFLGTVTATSGAISFNGGTNLFTGGFSIGSAGSVVIHDSRSIPANEVVTMAGGFLTLGSNLTIGALTGPVGSVINVQPPQGASPDPTATVLNANQPILLTINQATNTNYAGNITDLAVDAGGSVSQVTLGIEKKGVGVLTLTQSQGDVLSDYRGMTKISEGVLATTLLGFRGQTSALGLGGGVGINPGDLARNIGSAGLLYIENGAGLSYVGTNPTFTNRPFTIGVGALGAAIYANGSGLGNTVSMFQGRLNSTDALGNNLVDAGPDLIGFSKPNQAATLGLGGRNLGDNSFYMELHDNGSAPLSLQKSGDGNWVMGQPLGANVTLTNCTIGFIPAGNPVVTTDNTNVVTCDSTAGLVVGMTVTGPGIQAGTTIFEIEPPAAGARPTFLLSQGTTQTSNSATVIRPVISPAAPSSIWAPWRFSRTGCWVRRAALPCSCWAAILISAMWPTPAAKHSRWMAAACVPSSAAVPGRVLWSRMCPAPLKWAWVPRWIFKAPSAAGAASPRWGWAT